MRLLPCCLLALAGCVPPPPSTTPVSAPRAPAAKPTPPAEASVIRLTAVQLTADYDADEFAADRKYVGRVLEISGRVQSVGPYPGGASGPDFVLEATRSANVPRDNSQTIDHICCFLAPRKRSLLRAFQPATVRGTFSRPGQTATLKGVAVLP